MGHPTTGRRRAIERRVTTDFARDRLTRALFDVVTDGLELGPAALPSPADREWIRRAIAEPIRHAAEASLDRLADELDLAVVRRRPTSRTASSGGHRVVPSATPTCFPRRPSSIGHVTRRRAGPGGPARWCRVRTD